MHTNVTLLSLDTWATQPCKRDPASQGCGKISALEIKNDKISYTFSEQQGQKEENTFPNN